ncbi:MAG TPA: hypothetical protein VHU83_09850 [Bryobacteraceae bacterium]|jgi:hypothetical protein|nr:hypothetical protein [Bryobacteraceae bacterium]
MRGIVLIFLIAAAGRAEDACPFLNAATAAGILGGEVTTHLSGEICVFAHNSSELRIEVKAVTLAYKPSCSPNPTSLRSIGNEAVACESDHGEQIAGRVRDRAFFIRLTSNHIARAALDEKVRLAAEQVAGILF